MIAPLLYLNFDKARLTRQMEIVPEQMNQGVRLRQGPLGFEVELINGF
jgi:hypothetical protein